MKVGELKALLNEYPDDMEVIVNDQFKIDQVTPQRLSFYDMNTDRGTPAQDVVSIDTEETGWYL